ncbi:DUF1801 domain-containing protein [Salinarchaeum chitinilyticum]
MSTSDPLTAQRVSDLVLANRVIRAPHYDKTHDEGVEFTEPEKGLQWGADAIPALLGLFRVEPAPGDDPDRFVGFARHWRGGTLRLDVDRFVAPEEPEPILVVTAMAGRAGEDSIADEAFGEIELPAELPTETEWDERSKRYQNARRNDDTDGAAAVQAYVTALPGWKREIATRFDELVRREVPEVRSAVRYHQPFYGVEDRGWFASVTALKNDVKLTFVAGSYLEPELPSAPAPDRQSLAVSEAESLDEEQVAAWVRQAAEDPGMNW